MKKRFLTILTASVLLFGFAGLANNALKQQMCKSKKLNFQTNVY